MVEGKGVGRGGWYCRRVGGAVRTDRPRGGSGARSAPYASCRRGYPSPVRERGERGLPAELLVESEGVVVVALVGDLAVLDADEAHALELQRLVGGRGFGAPGPAVGAGELPLEGDAVGADDGLAGHPPFQVRYCTDEDLDHIVAGRGTPLLRGADGGVEVHRILGQEAGGLVGVVGIPGGHVAVDNGPGIVSRIGHVGHDAKQDEADITQGDTHCSFSWWFLRVLPVVPVCFSVG